MRQMGLNFRTYNGFREGSLTPALGTILPFRSLPGLEGLQVLQVFPELARSGSEDRKIEGIYRRNW